MRHLLFQLTALAFVAGAAADRSGFQTRSSSTSIRKSPTPHPIATHSTSTEDSGPRNTPSPVNTKTTKKNTPAPSKSNPPVPSSQTGGTRPNQTRTNKGHPSPTGKPSTSAKHTTSKDAPTTTKTPKKTPSTSAHSSTSSKVHHKDSDYWTLCKKQGKTVKNWQEYGMDDHLKELSDKLEGKNSFKDFVSDKTNGLYSFDCKSDGDCQIMDTKQGCNESPAKTNPQNWFILYSIHGFWSWIKAILNAIDAAKSDLALMANFLMVHFTSHDFKLAASTWENTMTAGVTGVLSAIFTLAALPVKSLAAPFTIAGSIASLAGSSATIGTSILSKMVTETVGVLQDEMNKGANMVEFMDQAIKGLRASVVQFGEDNINGIAANPPVTKDEYKKNETGIVSFLEGGAFASMINEDVDIKLKNETMKTLYAVAINEMWKQEQVYIVNTTGVMAPRGGSFELMKLDDDDIHRVNLDGTTFFLIKYSKDKSPAKKYEKVPGVDQLEHLGLTVEEVIHSSAYTMSKGGFNWNPSPEEWMSYSKHKADAPPANIFMNLPVCQFGSFGLSEYTTDVYNWKSICTSGSRTDDECEFKRLINKWCPTQVQTWPNGTKQEWPLKLYNKNWKPS